MANITIKNVPREIHEQLRINAEQHRRSLNSELIHCLEEALRQSPINSDDVLRDARATRPITHHLRLTDSVLKKAKSTGRP